MKADLISITRDGSLLEDERTRSQEFSVVPDRLVHIIKLEELHRFELGVVTLGHTRRNVRVKLRGRKSEHATITETWTVTKESIVSACCQ